MISDRRYQVFISATYTDLVEERRACMEAVLTLGWFPAGMEYFIATDASQWDYIKQVIDLSDFYVVIVGNRYGSLDGNTGLSFTEMEFDYALEKNKPVMAFLHKAPDSLPVDRSDIAPAHREALQRFREKLKTDRLCRFWSSIADLRAEVINALHFMRMKYPEMGWVPASQAADPRSSRIITDMIEENRNLKAQLAVINPEHQIESLIRELTDDFFDVDFYFSLQNQHTGPALTLKMRKSLLFLLVLEILLIAPATTINVCNNISYRVKKMIRSSSNDIKFDSDKDRAYKQDMIENGNLYASQNSVLASLIKFARHGIVETQTILNDRVINSSSRSGPSVVSKAETGWSVTKTGLGVGDRLFGV
jgi:hypothetical protein